LERKVRDSCGKSVAEGGPPAEIECLEWKSTIRFTNPQTFETIYLRVFIYHDNKADNQVRNEEGK